MTDVTNTQNKVLFTDELNNLINRVIDKAFEYENIEKINVSVLICDDEEIHRLNKEFRNIDKPTDVLSFPMYNENGELDEDELGDIVISLERAALQAVEYGHTLEREVAFLTAHSMLHLFGYDHMVDDEKEEMFFKQEEILSQLGVVR